MKNHLTFYRKAMKSGRLPNLSHSDYSNGLCCVDHISKRLLKIMSPTSDDYVQIRIDGHCNAYWGSGLPEHHHANASAFTPLRQNIVLFMAAMAGEL